MILFCLVVIVPPFLHQSLSPDKIGRLMEFNDDRFPGSTGNPEHDMDGREALLESSLGSLFDAFDIALLEGVSEPVLLLIDCEDPIGAPIARKWEGNDAVDAAIMSNAMEDETSDSDNEERVTTVLIKTVPLFDSQQELSQWFPYLADALARGPAVGGFYVVVISFGGAGVFTVPMATRPDQADQ